jgi:signal transduction histidine kinase
MRLYFVLIFTAVSMAFATGYIALFLQDTYTATSEDIVEINQIKLDFQKYVDPIYIVNFNSLYFSRDQIKLLDPMYTMPEDGYEKEPQRFFSGKQCFINLTPSNQGSYWRKIWQWEEHRCGLRGTLPRSFFINPPFIHPSGFSYAFLAYKLGLDGHHNKNWVLGHLPFFHVAELNNLRLEFGNLGGAFSILERLKADEWSRLARGRGTVLTRDFLFARLTYPKVFSILEYRIYSRSDLDKFLERTPYVLNNFKSGRSCFYRDGSLCWDYNLKHIFRLANTSTLTLFIGLIIIIAVVVRLLLVRIKNHRLEDEKRRLALRVLTHEFRTPVTSMMLLIERMGKKYGTFDEDMEDIFLRLSNEVHRMKRLTETSRHYLKAEQNKKLLHLNYEVLPSFNQFVEEIVAPYVDRFPGQVEFCGLEQDTEKCVDTYWLGICIKNIVENATIHGEFPIRVSIQELGNKHIVSVQDAGHCEFHDIKEMTEEFVKGNKSEGTGLGMNIVMKVCREMGGDIKLSLNPTIVSIILPKKRMPNA